MLQLGGRNKQRLELPFKMREKPPERSSSALAPSPQLDVVTVSDTNYSIIADQKVGVRDIRAALSTQMRVPRQFIKIYKQEIEISNPQPVNLT